MIASKPLGARLGGIVLGWAAATLAGIMITPILGSLFGLEAEAPREGGGSITVLVVFLVGGFLVYLVGGYVAAKLAGHPGGINGALTAVLGVIVGLFLAASGGPLALGLALPPISFGAGSWLLALLVPFFVNLLGGYVGGTLGEPSSPEK